MSHRYIDWVRAADGKEKPRFRKKPLVENKANEGYNRGEYEVWKASKEGVTSKTVLWFIYRTNAVVLHKLNTRLDQITC